MKLWLKKHWKFLLGIAISSVFLYLAVRGLKWEEFWISIKTANYI
jgi:hypothetical protein